MRQTLCAIVPRRYYAIAAPLHYAALVSPRRVAVGLAASWTGAILLCLPPFSGLVPPYRFVQITCRAIYQHRRQHRGPASCIALLGRFRVSPHNERDVRFIPRSVLLTRGSNCFSRSTKRRAGCRKDFNQLSQSQSRINRDASSPSSPISWLLTLPVPFFSPLDVALLLLSQRV